jgi:hypothetical protein
MQPTRARMKMKPSSLMSRLMVPFIEAMSFPQ